MSIKLKVGEIFDIGAQMARSGSTDQLVSDAIAVAQTNPGMVALMHLWYVEETVEERDMILEAIVEQVRHTKSFENKGNSSSILYGDITTC